MSSVSSLKPLLANSKLIKFIIPAGPSMRLRWRALAEKERLCSLPHLKLVEEDDRFCEIHLTFYVR